MTSHDLIDPRTIPGIEQLAEAGQVADNPAALQSARAALDAVMSAEQEPRPSRSRARWWVVPAAAAAAAALIIVPAVGQFPSTPPAASAQAATLLVRAADQIQPSDPPSQPGQYWRLESEGFTPAYGPGEGALSLIRSRRIVYQPVDAGQPIISDLALGAQALTGITQAQADELWPAGVRETWTLAYPDGNPNPGGSWQQPTPGWLVDLPRDPDALRERLYRDAEGHGQSADGEVFVLVGDALATGLVPADLRAALYRVLATVPGVDITSDSADLGPASGVGLGRTEAVNGLRDEIIIDPDNGELVGTRALLTDPSTAGVPAALEGTVVEQVTSQRTLVDTVPGDTLAQVVTHTCTADGTCSAG